jgi:hypothetical protein
LHYSKEVINVLKGGSELEIIDLKRMFQERKCKNMDVTTNSLSKERKVQIEEVVREIVKDVDFNALHFVDIVSIVKKDGFVVEPHEMDIETTGCLFIDATNSSRTIWVNTEFKNPDNDDDVVFKKSRFITAHEYGHFKLHNSFTAHRDTYHREEPLELEADYFARSILMPLRYFNLCYTAVYEFSKQDIGYTTTILSQYFNVTKNKVSKRIADLCELNELLA